MKSANIDKKKQLEQSILDQIDESVQTKKLLKSQATTILRCADLISLSLKKGGKLILFGNGGSAADAQHISAEFVGRYMSEREPLPAIALTVNTSSLTAIGNDYGYERVFERQVNALCNRNDVVVGISTSGSSKNVLLGIEAAKSNGAITIGLTGKRTGNKLAKAVDIAIIVPSESTPRIQECHILVGHIISGLVERSLK